MKNLIEFLFEEKLDLIRIIGKNNIEKKLLNQLSKHNYKLIVEIYKDDLTKLENQKFYLKFLVPDIKYNRRKEDKQLLNKFIDYLKENKLNTIMFIDMANFKAINDLINHSIGDKVLQLVAKTIKFNGIPISIRRSGDEYILLGKEKDIYNLKTFFESDKFNYRLEKIIQKDYGNKKFPYNVFVGMGIKTFDLDFLKEIRTLKDIEDYSIFMEKEILLTELELDEYKSIKKNNKNRNLLLKLFKNINNIIKDSLKLSTNNNYRPIIG